jgi:hypothetical protein
MILYPFDVQLEEVFDGTMMPSTVFSLHEIASDPQKTLFVCVSVTYYSGHLLKKKSGAGGCRLKKRCVQGQILGVIPRPAC